MCVCVACLSLSIPHPLPSPNSTRSPLSLVSLSLTAPVRGTHHWRLARLIIEIRLPRSKRPAPGLFEICRQRKLYERKEREQRELEREDRESRERERERESRENGESRDGQSYPCFRTFALLLQPNPLASEPVLLGQEVLRILRIDGTSGVVHARRAILIDT